MSDVETLHDILRRSLKAGASDVHFHVGSPVTIRVAGVVQRKSQTELTPEATVSMLMPTLDEEQVAHLKKNFMVEVMVDVPQGGGRFRGSYYQQQYGLDAVFRVIPPAVPSLTDLNLPFRIGALTSFRYGLMFVTGPAGCGKTSTLSALVNHMNHNRQSHVLMLESPVEYRHKSNQCIINQREIGKHTESLPRALRAGLREAPDVIVVGDIYDKELLSSLVKE
jgi:twitching motility protein PilT